MSLLQWTQWIEASWLGAQVRASTYLFPAIEVVHLFGITILLAVVVVMNVRLLSIARVPALLGQIALDSARLFWVGLALTMLTGTVLFVTEAAKCFYSDAFRYKMVLLALALVFHFTVHRRLHRAIAPDPLAAKGVAAVSLALWFGVGVAGRFIGFS